MVLITRTPQAATSETAARTPLVAKDLSLAGAWIPILTAVIAIVALEIVATEPVAPPPAWVEMWSGIAFAGLFAGFFGLSVRNRWGLAGVGLFGLVLAGMALVCFFDGHRNAELAVQAISGAAVLASVKAGSRIG